MPRFIICLYNAMIFWLGTGAAFCFVALCYKLVVENSPGCAGLSLVFGLLSVALAKRMTK